MKKLFLLSCLILSFNATAGQCTDIAIKITNGKATVQEYKVWKNYCKSMTATDYTIKK